MLEDLKPGPMAYQPDVLAQQRRQIALDMALRYFPAKSAVQLTEYAKVFEKFLQGESA